MLNYAAGVQFPSPIAPPIIVTPLILCFKSGNAFKRIAKFVIAPVTTNSTSSSCSIIRLYICKNGFLVTAVLGDFFKTAPSSPDLPCISAAVFNFLQMGPSAPCTTSISDLPIQYRMLSAFFVVFSMTEFPAEVEIPIKSILSFNAAMMIANMSSWPGSQSSQTFIVSMYANVIKSMGIDYLHNFKHNFKRQQIMIQPETNKIQENKQLLEQARIIFIEIKANYADFLTSLRYENLNDKKKNKYLRRKIEDISGYDNYESNLNKNFSFEQQLMIENKGYSSFLKLIQNIKKLEWINHELGAAIFLEERAQTGLQEIENNKQMLEQIEKGLLSFLQPYSKSAPK